MKFFQSFEQIIDNELTNIISTQLVLFADQMVFLIQIGAPILILYYGYSIMSGRGSNATVSEMMWNMARIGMIFAFMQNTGNLLDLSIGFIQELKSGFVGADSVFSLLDQQIASTKKLAEDLYSLDVNYIPLKGFLAAGMLWLGSIFVVVAASIIYISSSVCLTLLLATAPIFIGCLVYGFLKENFNGWLRAILSCIASLIFASMISRIGVSLNGQFVQYVSQFPDKSMLLEVGALNLATGIIIGFLLLKSTGLAGSIAGVAASSAIQGGMLGMARMHVIWTKLLTPDYKRVNLVDTQVVGRLGEAGIDGRVNSHFAQRFGGALMVSLIKDIVAGVSEKHSGKTRKNIININTFENTKDSTTSIVERMLDASVNIPPTMYKKQGDIIGIEVGKDIDFSKIYHIRGNSSCIEEVIEQQKVRVRFEDEY